MINPIQMVMQAAHGGVSPQQFFQQIGAQNPVLKQLQQITNGKNHQELMQIAENMAKERGTSVQAVMQSLGIPTSR